MSITTRVRRTSLWGWGLACALLPAGLLGCRDAPDAGSPGDVVHVGVSDLQLWGVDSDVSWINDLTVAEDGSVILLAGAGVPLHHYLPSGEVAARSDLRGRGPGELVNPWNLLHGSANAESVRVWDAGSRRVQRVTWEGPAWNSPGIPIALSTGAIRGDLPALVTQRPRRVLQFGSGFIASDHPRGVMMPSQLAHMNLTAFDEEGFPVDTLWQTDDAQAGGATPTTLGFLAAYALWSSCSPDEVALYDPAEATVYWFREGHGIHATVKLIVAERELERIEQEVIAGHFLDLETDGELLPPDRQGAIDRLLHTQPDVLPQTAPQFSDLLCGDEALVLLQRFRADTDPLGRSGEWLVVGKSGPEGLALTMPARFRPLLFRGSTVWGSYRDSFEVNTVASWQISTELAAALEDGRP